MRLILDLPPDLFIALRRFGNGTDTPSNEEAANLALREYLIGTGDLAPTMGTDGEVAGRA
ncbi:hypothetical protein [Mesorhizobium australicum]|uniref:hypothetical protein n=1 Tax=Mesorhizobium australicum TaxID=536018 RepID=UPI00333970C3